MTHDEEKRPNLYLVGFMGTGKSVVGRRLAEALHMRFIDSDHEIERREGRSVSEIFADQGEPYFRRLERAFVEDGHPPRGCVVSCGGGLIVQPGMVDRLKARGVLVCLFASADTIIKRTAGNSTRPLLAGEAHAERVRKLLAEREPVYKRAGTLITTDFRPISEIIQHVRRVYQAEAGKFPPPGACPPTRS